MIKEMFSRLKSLMPKEAAEFVADQEILAVFLNSPKREEWIRKAGMKPKDAIESVVSEYAKMKVDAEKKLKEKTRENVIKIEDECLQKLFIGRTMKLKKGDKKAELSIIKNIIEQQYKGAAIVDRKQMEIVAKAAGISKKPTEFIVFDADAKKIVGVNVI
ncbi:MAG: hypothetical protein PHO02_05320 [Candidatus Nanoarchaeia archaeon]|nr:hypothetical protein [Candidatus Nanoarchaeia archaeon]